MTMTTPAATGPSSLAGPSSGLASLINRVFALFEKTPHSAIALLARISVGATFWMSGQTKVTGFMLADGTVDLFRDEYRLPLIDPAIAAVLAAISEHLFSALLIIGFASRFAALALLGMTFVIEIFVYPDAWAIHGTWATCFLIIIARGPGAISLDHLLFGRRRMG
jgi:putative oxidoreductase